MQPPPYLTPTPPPRIAHGRRKRLPYALATPRPLRTRLPLTDTAHCALDYFRVTNAF